MHLSKNSKCEVKNMSDYLYHHGILGQKWGVRRWQNADGSYNAAGKQRYGQGKVVPTYFRAGMNSTLGQKIAVSLNKGYRKDKKEIKEAYKEKKAQLKEKGQKDKIKELKSDLKKTKLEAKVTTAQVLYPWQSKKLNEITQQKSVGKAFGQSLLMGGYGTLKYDQMRSSGMDKGNAFVTGLLTGTANNLTGGLVGVGNYAYDAINYNKKGK